MRTMAENRDLCDGKKKQWAAFKSRWRGCIYSATMMRTRGAAIITVATSQDRKTVERYMETAEAITAHPRFAALEPASFTIGIEENRYPAGIFYDLRIRITF